MSRLNRLRGAALWTTIATIATTIGSCGGEDLSLDIRDEDDPRFDAIRRQLDIVILPGPEWEEDAEVACTPFGCEPSTFAQAVWERCIDDGSARNDDTGCGYAASAADANVCTALLLMQVVESPMTTMIPLAFGGTNVPRVDARVPPQDAESNGELSRIATEYAGEAVRVVAVAMNSAIFPDCDAEALALPAGPDSPLSDLTIAQELAAFHGEAVQLAQDAASLASQHGAAVSDAAFSRRTDNAEASVDTLAPFASRTAAAHLLIGGAHGLPALRGVAESGFFSRPRLSGEGQHALQMLRAAAVSPARILDRSLSLDDLVQGAGGVPAAESIRFRLGHIQGRPALLNAPNAGVVFELLGASPASFSEAREHLREELLAFDRSPDALLPPERLPDGSMTSDGLIDIALYAATRVPPRQPLPTFWSAVLRYDPTPQVGFTGSYTLFGSPPPWPRTPNLSGDLPAGDTFGDETGMGAYVRGRRSVASILDEAMRVGPHLMDRFCPDPSCTGAAGLREARDLVATTLAAVGANPPSAASATGVTPPAVRYGNAAHQGRARACVFGSGSDPWSEPVGPGLGIGPFYEVLVQVETPDSIGLAVVRGHEGLDCAVRGEVEGAACDDDWWPSSLVFADAWTAEGDDVHTAHVTGQVFGDRPNAGTLPLFIVRRRTGTGDPLPGQFEELSGFILPAPPDPNAIGYQYCLGAPISSDLDAQASELIEPSPSAPFGPANLCAGLPSDLRIPLENELTSDDAGGSPGIESSWRHYLELARRSAAEADELGEDLIRTGLEMDLRAEAAADELSRLCGVAINLTSISNALTGEGAPPREAPAGPPCVVPYREHAGHCVLDPVLYAVTQASTDDDMARLAACMGADRVAFATLGDQPLCIWDTTPGRPGGVCEGSDRDGPVCPYSPTSDGVCDPAGVPDGLEPILVDHRIGIFQQPAEPVAPPPDRSSFPCEGLARVRAGRGTGSDLEPVYNFLAYDTFSSQARDLTWEAALADYSRVLFGGSLAFATGAVAAGPGVRWPMGPGPEASCPGGSVPHTTPVGHIGPLFCIRELDRSREVRARMNDLLARAVLAARIYTGLSPRDIVVPYYPANAAERYEEAPATFAWQLVPGTTPRAFTAFTGRFTVDHRTSGDLAEAYPLEATDLGSWFGYVEGGASSSPCGEISPGVDWASCPYDRPGCLHFDREPDCDDAAGELGNERNSPFIARAMDEDLGLADAAEYAADRWDALIRPMLVGIADRDAAELRRPPADVEVRRLTRYLDTWAEDGRASCDMREYEACVGDQGRRRLMAEGNLAFIGRGGLTLNDIMNGAELACWAARSTTPAADTSCSEPRAITSLADAYRARGYLDCRANEISAFGAGALLEDVPQRVVDALRADGSGSYGSGAGELDAQVSELRAALLELSTLRTDLANDLRAYSGAIRSLDSGVSTAERAGRIDQLMSTGRVLDRAMQCVTAVADAVTTDGAAAAAKGGAAAAICVASAGQIFLEREIARLRAEDVEDAVLDQLARFDAETAAFSGRMSDRATGVRAALERIDAALSRLQTTQTQARRALTRALLLDDDGMGEHFEVNTVYRARYNTQLARYRRAHTRAIRSAFIARLALEQRLGMPLADIEDDVFSDEPPRQWVDEICTLPSIDYDRIRMSVPTGTGEREEDGVDFAPPADYSGAYVGDYVRRLEDVFESYSFVHPFREGADTAVISLRDDVFRTRAPCPVVSSNLLFNGGRLDVFASSERPGWSIEGCDVAAATTEDRSCVAVARVDAPEPPGTVADARFGGRAIVYEVEFGDAPVTSADTRLEQIVPLQVGRYRLSWYQHLPDGPTTVRADLVALGSGGDLALAPAFAAAVGADGSWERRWIFFDVEAAEPVAPVALALRRDALEGAVLAGVMLEDVTRSVVGDVTRDVAAEGGGTLDYGATHPPAPFYESGDSGRPIVSACLDQRGDHFRREAWEYGCVRVCRDGYDGNCPEDGAETRCYWQTSFGISSDALETALLAGDAGFASGNYNYRIDDLAVNLVGTALRDCDGRETAGCYASGSTSFSIIHQGPYLVRNALGAIYEAPLFTGRLESARALAAERYVTNPLSSADRALVEPFTRYELQGRPLGGSLLLRLWEDPSFRFERLEDVQVVLGYRYWQHQR